MSIANDERSRRDVDVTYPSLHVRPPSGWVNDPNGPVFWRGRWHLFYQHNPYGPVHERIHWGHASSSDLVTWRDHPIALVPSDTGPDHRGCWSGCVVDDAGTATAVYTGVAEDVSQASICLAFADDDNLDSWTKAPKPVAEPPSGMALRGFRDPFVFTHDGRRYALVGAGLATGGAAMVLLYSCDNLREWTYLGPLLTGHNVVAAQHAPADIWECPQLVRLNDSWVLIVSLWTNEELGRVAYLTGQLVAHRDGLSFEPSAGGYVDEGHDMYAPAVLVEPDRVLMWGWTWEARPESDVEAVGWAGALTFPRTLAVDDAGELTSAPAAELSNLRGKAVGTSTTDSCPLPAGAFEVRWRRPARGVARLDLSLGGSDVALVLDEDAGTVSVEHDGVAPRHAGRHSTGVLAPASSREVRVLVDGSVVAVYVAGGPTFTERLYAAEGQPSLLRHMAIDAADDELTVWPLRRVPAATSPHAVEQ